MDTLPMIFRKPLLRLVLFLALSAWLGASHLASTHADPPTPAGRYALLVGVTDYPHLARHLWLEGGANDVLLLKHVLTRKYGFPDGNIVTLSEAEGKKSEKLLPSRANIERECKALAARVKQGDKVVVFLAGHGSRVPESENAKIPAPDGFRKIFLPRDVRDWDKDQQEVPNAIEGREFGAWLRPIPQNKATLWVIVDACHSGTMIRGSVQEKVREIDPVKGLKVPDQAIDQVLEQSKRAAKNLTHSLAQTDLGPLARMEGVVLTYACLSKQVTLEGRYKHPESSEYMPFGLLTHTLSSVLWAANQPMTYRELLVRVQNAYKEEDRESPSPVIEGSAQGKLVLGDTSTQRNTLSIARVGDKLVVNGGSLHGLTSGTILSVYPPVGSEGGLKGYTRIVKLAMVRSEVEPVAYEKTKAPEKKDIINGRCEIAEVAYDDLMKLQVAIDPLASPSDQDRMQLAGLRKTLDKIAADKGAVIEPVADPATALWLLRLDKSKVYLVPRTEWEDQRPESERRRIGPPPLSEKTEDWLRTSFQRIARGQNLIRLANTPSTSEEFQARVEVAIERPGEKKREPAEAVSVQEFFQGDEVRLRLRNPGKTPIDVTVLYVNSKFKISALFPLDEHNRIEPGKEITVPPVDIDTATSGREYLVAIAVKSQGDLMDFAALNQPSIAEAQRDAKTRGRSRSLETPLGLLLQTAVYQEGSSTRMKRRELENYSTQVIPVTILPGKRSNAKE